MPSRNPLRRNKKLRTGIVAGRRANRSCQSGGTWASLGHAFSRRSSPCETNAQAFRDRRSLRTCGHGPARRRDRRASAP